MREKMNDGSHQTEATSTTNSLFVPLVVYGLSLAISALAFTLPAIILHWSKDYQIQHLYLLGTLAQLLMDLPAVVIFFRMKPAGTLSFHDRRSIVSGLLGIAAAAALAGLRILILGRLLGGRFMGEVPAFTQSLNLPPPWNILTSIAALLAYGPGEAIFVAYLILALDKALGNHPGVFSRGVWITAILWALPHLFNIFYFGLGAIPNALIMFFIGLAMGVLLKGTRSSWGPILFWTLVNGTSA
jgi:hypothetical protein